MRYLNDSEFEGILGNAKVSLFRLQTLPEYRVPTELADFTAFIEGQSVPSRDGNPWIEFIKRFTNSRRSWQNFHILPSPETDYFRYLVEWWYIYHQAAGIDIRIVSPSAMNEEILKDFGDFWLIDSASCIRLQYQPDGTYIGATHTSEAGVVARCIEMRTLCSEGMLTLSEYIQKKSQ